MNNSDIKRNYKLETGDRPTSVFENDCNSMFTDDYVIFLEDKIIKEEADKIELLINFQEYLEYNGRYKTYKQNAKLFLEQKEK